MSDVFPFKRPPHPGNARSACYICPCVVEDAASSTLYCSRLLSLSLNLVLSLSISPPLFYLFPPLPLPSPPHSSMPSVLGSAVSSQCGATALVNMASDGMILTNHDHQIRVGVLTGKCPFPLNVSPLRFGEMCRILGARCPVCPFL